MGKFQAVDHSIYEWPLLSEGKKRRSKPPKKEPQTRQSQEDMIRELQNIFCKGRYRSWVLSQGRRKQ